MVLRAKISGGRGKGKGIDLSRKTRRETILGITKPANRRLARRGGVKRIISNNYVETCAILQSFLE